MNSQQLCFVFGAALVLFSAGCRKKPSPLKAEPGSDASATAAPRAGGPPEATSTNASRGEPLGRLLRAQWPVGSRYLYRMEIEQHRTTATPAPAQPTTEDLSLGVTYALTVEEEISGGGRELELEFLANDLEIKIGGEVAVQFSAAKGATNTSQRPVPPPFRKMLGSKALLWVGPKGRVEKVLGYDMWLKTVAGDNPSPAGQMLAQQFNEEFFRQLADIGRGLADHPVTTGESWPNRDEVPSPDLGKIVMDSTITLSGWEEHDQRQLAALSAVGSLRSEPLPGQPSPARMSITHGEVKGKTWFDPQAGTLIESLVEETIQMKGSVPDAPTNAAPASFTSDIAQKVSLKLVETGQRHP